MNTTSLNDKSLKQNPIPFAFPAPAARQVSLAGDFNNWDPKSMPMRKGADGVWHLNVALKPGHHEYRFVADGVWQDDPAAQQRAANTLGGENCVKIVNAEIIGGQAKPQGARPGEQGISL
jgi:1,4-alpha-glucan branching enzyme